MVKKIEGIQMWCQRTLCVRVKSTCTASNNQEEFLIWQDVMLARQFIKKKKIEHNKTLNQFFLSTVTQIALTVTQLPLPNPLISSKNSC